MEESIKNLTAVIKTSLENPAETENTKLQTRLDRLYSCRDLEISNLWQRSLFLSSFTILAFSAYGFLIYDTKIDSFMSFKINALFIGLCFISTVVSFFWLLMNKSSKAWYEVYEQAISQYERDLSPKLGIKDGYIMGELNLDNKKIDNNPFCCMAGAFSPSRINIAISIFSFIIWGILFIVHTAISFNTTILSLLSNNQSIISILASLLLMAVIIFSFINVKSSHLPKRCSKYSPLIVGISIVPIALSILVVLGFVWALFISIIIFFLATIIKYKLKKDI